MSAGLLANQPPAVPPGSSLRRLEEMQLATSGATDVYRRIQQWFASEGGQQIQRRNTQVQQLMRDLGVTFGLYHEETGKDHIVPFDPFPRVIDSAEWESLSRGILQRMRIWNSFFTDIYDSQEVLKAGLVPFELVYDDPHFQRAAVGIKVPENTYVHVAAFDLARDARGRWVVIEDYVSNTTGASYALQARHVLSQVCPELLETANVEPVHGYATALLEQLRRHSHGAGSEPRVVLLSPGFYNQAYYEHSYLARQMGIPLVRGSDLIVLNSQVYLKTIGGLEPIDVIYRRTDETFIDPVAFRDDSQLGVPGLMSCVRKGTVTIANAIGTSLGDNRALASFLPKLARFYLNEPLLLPTVERLVCWDSDQCDQVLGKIEDYHVAAVSERTASSVWNAATMNETELAELRQRISSAPAHYVAEPQLPLSQIPTLTGDDFAPRHAGLRLFGLGGRVPQVYPCALTRFASAADSRVISSGLGGGIKDTWILRGEETVASEAPIIISSSQRRLRLGSRIADSLYWMGRYTERAENTTRTLKVLQLVQVEDQLRQNPESWVPLWEALARATGHPTNFFKRSALLRKQSVAQYILLDRNNPSSVVNCFGTCRWNAQSIRESVPPELWVILNRLYQMLDTAAGGTRLNDAAGADAIEGLQDSILHELDALGGAAAKNMLRDDGWHFWSMGIHVERALTTVLVTRQVLLKRQGESAIAPQRTDSNLDALLRMMSCQYAYRSLFQARPSLQNAATMLLQDGQLPRSLLYCLQSVELSLRTVFGEQQRVRQDTPHKLCARLVAEVSFTDLGPYFSSAAGRGPQLKNWLDELAGHLATLSTAISDHYLHHQAFNIIR